MRLFSWFCMIYNFEIFRVCTQNLTQYKEGRAQNLELSWNCGKVYSGRRNKAQSLHMHEHFSPTHNIYNFTSFCFAGAVAVAVLVAVHVNKLNRCTYFVYWIITDPLYYNRIPIVQLTRLEWLNTCDRLYPAGDSFIICK